MTRVDHGCEGLNSTSALQTAADKLLSDAGYDPAAMRARAAATSVKSTASLKHAVSAPRTSAWKRTGRWVNASAGLIGAIIVLGMLCTFVYFLVLSIIASAEHYDELRALSERRIASAAKLAAVDASLSTTPAGLFAIHGQNDCLAGREYGVDVSHLSCANTVLTAAEKLHGPEFLEAVRKVLKVKVTLALAEPTI